MSHATSPSTFERTCDCRCPAHHRRHRFAHNHPGCHCRMTCTTEPATLLMDHTAFFLNYHGVLWSVPELAPDRWDWRHAEPVPADSDLDRAASGIEPLLRTAAAGLRQRLS